MKIHILLFSCMAFRYIASAMHPMIRWRLQDDYFNLTGNSSIHVLIHGAGQIVYGRLRHVDNEEVPDWLRRGERAPNPPMASVLLHPHAMPTSNLITTEMRYSPAQFNNRAVSQCFIRDGHDLYKAILIAENSLVIFRSGNDPVVVVQTADSPTTWMGLLHRHGENVPYWVWD